jgi:hypothetical protein
MTAHFRRLCAVSRARLLLGALLRTIAMQRLLLLASRAPCAQPLLSNFSTFLSSVEPGEERLASQLLPDGSCRTAGIEGMGLHRIRQSVGARNRRPRIETALP